jgi:hypothetical protein
MNLLDDLELPKQQTRASLTKTATRLIGRRITRRGKKKKKTKCVKWKKEFAEAFKQQNLLKEEFARKIEEN